MITAYGASWNKTADTYAGLTRTDTMVDVDSLTLAAGQTLLGGTGVIKCNGNWDTSLGTWTPETCQVIITKASTITLAAEQTFYDLLLAPGIVATLGSNVTVSNIYGNNGLVVAGEYSVTASGSEYTLTDLPVVIDNLVHGPMLYPTGRKYMRRLERST